MEFSPKNLQMNSWRIGRGQPLIALESGQQQVGQRIEFRHQRQDRTPGASLDGMNRDGQNYCGLQLKVSPWTVRGDWNLARAWLYRELSRGGDGDPERWEQVGNLYQAALALQPDER